MSKQNVGRDRIARRDYGPVLEHEGTDQNGADGRARPDQHLRPAISRLLAWCVTEAKRRACAVCSLGHAA
jgi:hypothetical protein